MSKFQEIVSRASQREDAKMTPAESRSRIRSWRIGTLITTITLSCGHTKNYRGDNFYVPKNKALCNQC